ncbi:hypothetical protein FACS1894164_00060 [Spirochaetia bacterium]|nr:hypothetical protein FACS1894164_00060 [Spirochaetia bacterium]
MKRCIVIILLIGAGGSVFSQTKEEDIVRLLELTDTVALASQALEAYIPQLSALVPGIPDDFWDMFREKMDMESFVQGYIPLYDHFFSHEEIKDMIAFYESPTGRKLIEVQPEMTQRSMSFGQAWGQRLGQQIVEELQRGGYLQNL